MEVTQRRVEEEAAEEKGRPGRGDITSSSSDEDEEIDSRASNAEYKNQEEKEKINEISENSVYFDNKEGMWKCNHCTWTQKNGNLWDHGHVHQGSFDNGSRGTTLPLSPFPGKNLEDVNSPEPVNPIAKAKDKIESSSNASTSNPTPTDKKNAATRVEADKNVWRDVEEESDVEEIEVEFENSVQEAHTHKATPYCPKCKSEIRRVILRRKKHRRQPEEEKRGLFGCTSCFEIFTCSGKCLDPFGIFGRGDQKPVGGTTDEEERKCLSLSWIFKKRGDQKPPSRPGEDPAGSSKPDGSPKPEIPRPGDPASPRKHAPLNLGHAVGNKPPGLAEQPQPSKNRGDQKPPGLADKRPPSGPGYDPPGTSKPGESTKPEIPRPGDPALPREHLKIPILPPAGEGPLISQIPSKSFEILKCTVHGGLMESIASLSVVSSAAASDATTLNIIALGLASLISGLVVFGHNLRDLKNGSTNQGADGYEELLGTRGHFLFHATFATLSYLVFGIIPPAVYGFTFQQSDNKDYKILAVAAASFAIVFILGIGKAYVRRSQKLSEYVKTVLYYIVMAVSASGVAYAAGDLIKMLMDRLGWFQPNQTPPSLVPDAISATPKWASY